MILVLGVYAQNIPKSVLTPVRARVRIISLGWRNRQTHHGNWSEGSAVQFYAEEIPCEVTIRVHGRGNGASATRKGKKQPL